jgi:hypothetical protein|tara:strand:+ start:944 stop:1120 length:177 start_codon:yes stop_codon:yes gene_type:complete
MKYLALTDKGNLRDLGDCGDIVSANEIADEYICGEKPILVADVNYWYLLQDYIELITD